MNFLSALELIRCQVLDGTTPRKLFLACGFTPVYLPVFINAELIALQPNRKNEIKSGLFGDLLGNVQRGQASDCEALLVVVEWSDIDPRLGVRTLGGWRVSDLPSILCCCGAAVSPPERSANGCGKYSPDCPVFSYSYLCRRFSTLATSKQLPSKFDCKRSSLPVRRISRPSRTCG